MTDTTSLRLNIDSTSARTATKDLNNLNTTSKKTQTQSTATASAFKLLGTAIAAVGVTQLVKNFVETADTMKLLDARLKLVTSSIKEFTYQQKALHSISLDTYSDIKDITTLYVKLNPALKQLGKTTKEINQVTSNFSKGLKLGGASASEASAATLQFAQAMGSGVLRGDEFNSMAEASPKLMAYMAAGMGVAQTSLREMAAQGKLTSETVANALLKMSSEIDKDFKTLPATVGNATTNLHTNFSLIIKDIDASIGATNAIATSMENFAKIINENKNDIVKFASASTEVAKQVAEIGASLLIANTALKTYTSLSVSASAANSLLSGSYGAVNRAIILTTISTKSLSVATKAIPFVAFASATYGLIELLPKLTSETSLAEQAMNDYADSIKGASNATIDFEISKITKELAKVRKAANDEARDRGIGAPVSGYGETLAYELTELSKQLDMLKAQKKAINEKANAEIQSVVKSTELKKNIAKNSLKWTAEQYAAEKEFNDAWNASEEEDRKAIEEKIKLEEEFGETLNENFDTALDTQISMLESTASWSSSLDDIAGQYADIGKAITSVSTIGLKETQAQIKLADKFNDDMEKFVGDKEKQEKLKQQYVQDSAKIEADANNAKIAGLSLLVGAMGSAYERGSNEAIAFAAVQSTLGIASAWTAIAEAWALPFPGNLSAVALVAANVMPIISQLGGSTGSVSTSYDYFSAMDESTGTGTIFGDKDAQSDSIANSLEIVSDYAEPQYKALVSINSNILSLSDNIGKFVNQAVTQGDIKGDFTNFSIDSAFDRSSFSDITSIVSDSIAAVLTGGLSFVFGGLGDFIGGALSGVFGGGSESSLLDYGAKFNEQLITQAIEDINASAYDVIKTVTDGGWFHSDSESYNTYFRELDGTLKDNMQMVLGSVYDTVIQATTAIGMDKLGVIEDLSDFMLEEAKISFNKSGDEIEEDFTAYISSIFDKLAGDALNDSLDKYRDVGEGLGETLTRVATGYQVVSKNLSLINDTVVNNMIDVSQTLIDLSGSLDDFSDSAASYYDEYFSEAEKVADVTSMLAEYFTELGIAVPKTNEQFRNIIESLDLNTKEGQATYITMMQLAESFSVVGDYASGLFESERDNILTLHKLQLSLIEEQSSAVESAFSAVESLINASDSSLQSSITTLRKNSTDTSMQVAELYRKIEDARTAANNEDYESLADLTSYINSNISLISDSDLYKNSSEKRYAELVTANSLEGIDTGILTQLDYLKLISEGINNLVINGVEATFSIDDTEEDLIKKIAKGYDWNTTQVSTLTNLGYSWSIEDIDKYTALGYNWDTGTVQDLISLGYDWDTEKLEGLTDLSYNWNTTDIATLTSLGYDWDLGNIPDTSDLFKMDWNQDGLVDAVKIVNADGTSKLEFDWNNDGKVDITALVGQDGTLTSINDNTDKTTSAIDLLNQNLALYNKALAEGLGIGGELTLEDFLSGGSLNTMDEIDFRQSFTAVDASTFSDELEELRKNLAYLSLDNNNLYDLSQTLDSNNFGNIKEFLSSVGDTSNFDTALTAIDYKSSLDSLDSYLNEIQGKIDSAAYLAESSLAYMQTLQNNLENTSAVAKHTAKETDRYKLAKQLEEYKANHNISAWINASKGSGFDWNTSATYIQQYEAEEAQYDAYKNALDAYNNNYSTVANDYQNALDTKTSLEQEANAKQEDIDNLEAWLSANGFAGGGYTGNIGVSDIAGVVHGREFVLDAQTTASAGITGQVSQSEALSRLSGNNRNNNNMSGALEKQNYLLNAIITKQDRQIQILSDSREIQGLTVSSIKDLEMVV